MQRLRHFQVLIGAVLLLAGLVIMAGWLIRMPGLVQLRPDFIASVFSSALCFALTGAALLRAAWRGGAPSRISAFLGAALAAVAVAGLLENLFDADWLPGMKALHGWLADGNPRPGRMSLNGSAAFLLCGAVLILMQRAPRRWAGLAIQAATFAVLALGLIGLASHSLPLDLVFAFIPSPPMAIPTGVGIVLASAGLWLGWQQANWYQKDVAAHADEAIGFVGTAILVVITLTAGVAGFAGHADTLERSLADKLWATLDSRLSLFDRAVDRGIAEAVGVAARADLAAPVERLAGHPADAAARTRLRAITRGMLHAGVSGIAILDAQGRELFRDGALQERPEIAKDIGRPFPVSLLWAEGYYLRTHAPLIHDGRRIGSVLVEQPLPLLDGGFFQTGRLGESGEMGMCFASGADLNCYPQARNPRPYRAPRLGNTGKPTPMQLALEGRRALFHGVDYRGQSVIGVHAPVESTGIAMAVKMNTEELFAPIRQQILWGAPLLLLFIALGAWLLRSQVKPLAARLLMSESEARGKEQHVRAVVDNVGEAIFTFDDEGRIESGNAAAIRIFGYRRGEAVGRHVGMLFAPEARAMFEGEAVTAIVGCGSLELNGLRKSGETFLLEIAVNAIESNGRRLFVVIARDITERKQAQAALFSEKERLRVTLGSIGDAVIATDTAGAVTYLNPVAERMTGWSNAEAAGHPLREVFCIVDERSGAAAPDPVETVLRSKQAVGLTEGALLAHKTSGARCPIEDSAAPILDADGAVIGVVLVFRDVSQARKMAAEMSYQATHDALTGLINRREFERRLALSLQTGMSERRKHTLLYIDLDQFKIVNDTCGHAAGDELLRQITSVLGLKLRQSDTLARLGGDEFGVLLEGCGTAPAVQIAENLRRTVADFRFVWQDKTFSVGATIGLVTFVAGAATLEDVLRMADTACYAAKEKGRNRVQVYSPDDKELAQRHGEMGWMGRIKSALEQDRFVLYEQAIKGVVPEDGGGRHRELLLRMVDEDGHLVPPMAFIPAAERYGLMPELDRWVIRAAFARHADTHHGEDAHDICAINISGASICDPHFLQFVLEQFALHAIPPDSICFEITETAAIANLAEATAFIRELKAAGCRFALDDFGAGMSSFTYLKHLPVDFLKIDGSFVKGMLEDPIDRVMVQSINHIGQAMNIRTIAEFVENEHLLEALREMGVDFAQGYGIEKPRPMTARTTVGKEIARAADGTDS